MADTRQCVFWSLERACKLRSGEGWQFPIATSQQLSQLQRCSEELSKKTPDIVDGIWVTGQYWGNDAANNSIYIPASGMQIDEIGREYGGWDTVRSTCANCVANVLAKVESHDADTSPSSQGADSGAQPSAVVGGCFGTLEVMYPGSGSLDELLWRVIHRYDLEDQLRDAFQLTDPLWFGFWMDSPLDRKQCRGLLDLLSRALPQLWSKPEDDPAGEPVFGDVPFAFSDFNPAETYGREYAAFFKALEAALRYDLPLHVHVPPPGHTDLGYYTIFAHCPRCKAAADVPRWEEVQSSDYQCTVCGHRYDPAATHSSQRDDHDFEVASLEKLLGDRYDDFVIRYGQQHGHTPEQMIEALDIHRDGPRKRMVASCRQRVREIQEKFGSNFSDSDCENLPQELLIELAPGVILEFILAPAGEFQMGERPTKERIQRLQPDAAQSEDSNQIFDWCDTLPLHTVRFEKPFYIGKYPVTQAQWRAVMGNNPSKIRFPNNPVEQVDWFAAQAFCAQLSERLGRVMRLPSEAEWEYACRAGTTTRCYCGDKVGREDGNLDHDLKVDEFPSMDRLPRPRTTPVDRYPPNPWGIYDMLGNVEEWCQDSWHNNYVNAPLDGSAWIDSPEPIEHVARGGAAYLIAEVCSAGFRRSQRANCGADPQSDDADETVDEASEDLFGLWSSDSFYGLRLVCEPDHCGSS